MYFFRVSKLADDLREGRVGEKEQFRYFLATLVGWGLIAHLCYFSGATFTREDSISAAVNMAVIVIGTILCYRVNKRGDNTDFIKRMICLGWPVGIWIVLSASTANLLLSAISSLPAAAIGRQLFLTTMEDHFLLFWNMIPGVLFLVPYYSVIYGYLDRVAGAEDSKTLLFRPIEDLSVGEFLLGFFGGMAIVAIALVILIAGESVSHDVHSIKLQFLCTGWPILIIFLIFLPALRRSKRKTEAMKQSAGHASNK